MAATMSAARLAFPKERQNWILAPLHDALFVVLTPVIALALALALFASFGAADATTYILLLHVVLTVAHHMPTFIRIYGDLELFRRFKWTFILGPTIPFSFAACVLIYLNAREFPVENLLYLFVLLTIWDPWHFLMQHYGFMRIYDRRNQAPKELASGMDRALCVTWFVYIMLASGEWLTGLLEDMYFTANLPLLLRIPDGALSFATATMFTAAAVATVAYGVYLAWCLHRGYFVSLAKLALFVSTFGVMFLAYTPNDWILTMAPGWSFKVGFAVLGIVHVTQYLAIVWRYNRGLAAQPDRARTGLFRRAHQHGGYLAGSAYVLACVVYGAVLTSVHENRWVMSVLLAVGFTSTLMHYYFDGFMWKMRHRQNREGLSDIGADETTGMSWWDAVTLPTPMRVLTRQTLYFAVPMGVLTIGAFSVWSGAGANYAGHMVRAQSLYEQGKSDAAYHEARLALESMERQLPAARKLLALDPTASREAALSLLVYNRSRYAELLLPTLEGFDVSAQALERHRENVAEAVRLLQRAIDKGVPLLLPGGEELRREGAVATLASWRRELESFNDDTRE